MSLQQWNIMPKLVLSHYCKTFEALVPTLREFYILTAYAASGNMATWKYEFLHSTSSSYSILGKFQRVLVLVTFV